LSGEQVLESGLIAETHQNTLRTGGNIPHIPTE